MSTSIDDLLEALEEEAHAHHARYQEFAKQAEGGGHLQASKMLRAIVVAETARVRRYRQSMSNMGGQTEGYDYHICPGCGYAQGSEAPDACPVCETAGESFEKIE